jgi:trans-aconitate 2-methyltransferase
MSRLTLDVPGTIYDLGCGPGNLTHLLQQKWPDRRIVGVDSSPDMLAEARKKYGDGGIEWLAGDIAGWQADEPAALVFTNAALHWLDNHDILIPRLMRQVAPGGLLAIQMPDTARSNYTSCIVKVKSSARWKDRLAGVTLHMDPHPAAFYYDLLARLAAPVDIWQTEYRHVLSGEHPVTEWIKSTGLVPVLSVLDEAEKAAFLADYNAAAAAAYPRQIDGHVLFDMHRIFILAKRT